MCYNENGDDMKDLLKICFCFCIVLVVYIFKDSISNFITDDIVYRDSNKILTYNEYYLNYNYQYVQNIDTNKAKNKQDVLNIFYTIINSGDDNYSFYCDYDGCIDDVKAITDNSKISSDINSFVHPYNSFKTININITNSGKVIVKNDKLYKEDEINFINTYIDTFISNNTNDGMNNKDKIKIFHDHIINNTIYDINNKEASHTAYTLIMTGRSICGGYSDIMSIYLNKLGIQNYRITSENHVWNLIYLDGIWYHLDATWDDPVASDGKQYLLHNFFLISTNELLKLDTVEHTFDTNVFLEAK